MALLELMLGGVAQATATTQTQCSVYEGVSGGNAELYGKCGDVGFDLGPLASYSSVVNPPSGAVIVVIRQPTQTKVLILRPTADHGALLEDIAGDLAKAAGRSVDAGIDGLSVDLNRFALDGIVQLASEAVGAASKNDAQFAISKLVAAEEQQKAIQGAVAARVDGN